MMPKWRELINAFRDGKWGRCLNVTKIMNEAPVDRLSWIGALQLATFGLFLLFMGDMLTESDLYWRARFSPDFVGILGALFMSSGVIWLAGLWIGSDPTNRVTMTARQQVTLSCFFRYIGSFAGWILWAVLFWLFFLERPFSFGVFASLWLSLQDGTSFFRLIKAIETYGKSKK